MIKWQVLWEYTSVAEEIEHFSSGLVSKKNLIEYLSGYDEDVKCEAYKMKKVPVKQLRKIASSALYRYYDVT